MNTRNIVSTLALTAALTLPTASMADEVTLKSSDGTVNIIGEFVDFVDNNYIIRTSLGDLRVSATRVRCEGDACPDFSVADADVKFAGSDTIGLGVMPVLMSGYAGFLGAESQTTTTGQAGQMVAELVGEEGFGDPIGTYLVSSSGSSDAFSALLDKSAQIGMAARRIRPQEARALRDGGAGKMIDPKQENIIAIDSLVVITHPDNTVESLTMDQLRRIYSGEITNWAEVGGTDAEIVLYDRAVDTGTRTVFVEGVFGDDAPDGNSPRAMLVENDNQMAANVNADVNAIGFVGYAFQRGARAMTLINDCGLTMIPDDFSARTEEYSLQRFLYLYNRSDTADEPTKAFLNYAISKDADQIMQKAGFIDLGVDRRSQPLDSDRARQLLDPNVDAFEGGLMRQMLAQMGDYDRLSTTFRFRTGSQKLTPRGELNMLRLVDYLENQPKGTNILVVGFTDDVGAFESNRVLSNRRAEQVKKRLQEFAGDRLAGITIGTAGYGEVAPTACNTSDKERSINRRVEIWVRSNG